MDIKSFFTNILPGNHNHARARFGAFNLAKESDRRRLRKISFELQRSTDALTRKDIADWRAAWQLAISVDNPDRNRLYDIYNDVDIDLHLTGCIAQRIGFVMAKSFKIVDQNGDEDEQAMHYFDQAWFKQLCRLSLQSIYGGHSLIELGDITTDGDGCICYSGVSLIPRKHVIPEYGRVVPQLHQDWRSGVDYRKPPYSHWLIEAGQPCDLGLYLKAATQTIPKKNVLAFWDTFSEIFGMPMRIAKTTSRDDKDILKLDKMLQDSGANMTMVAPMDTEIEFVETAKGDSFNVYDRRIDRANSEISKLIIGQTMTIEDGSSLSQSETHLKVFDNLVESDADMLRDIINNQLIPRMVRHGFPLKGRRFDWDESIDYSPEQQKAFEDMVLQHYDVAPEYFEEKYGIPCEPRSDAPMLPADGGEPSSQPDDNSHNNNTQNNSLHPGFFD